MYNKVKCYFLILASFYSLLFNISIGVANEKSESEAEFYYLELISPFDSNIIGIVEHCLQPVEENEPYCFIQIVDNRCRNFFITVEDYLNRLILNEEIAKHNFNFFIVSEEDYSAYFNNADTKINYYLSLDHKQVLCIEDEVKDPGKCASSILEGTSSGMLEGAGAGAKLCPGPAKPYCAAVGAAVLGAAGGTRRYLTDDVCQPKENFKKDSPPRMKPKGRSEPTHSELNKPQN